MASHSYTYSVDCLVCLWRCCRRSWAVKDARGWVGVNMQDWRFLRHNNAAPMTVILYSIDLDKK